MLKAEFGIKLLVFYDSDDLDGRVWIHLDVLSAYFRRGHNIVTSGLLLWLTKICNKKSTLKG